MKKYISILLCLTLIVGLASPMRVFALDYTGSGVVVEAQQVLSELDVTKPITEDLWGKATIHVDKDSANTSLLKRQDNAEEPEMDVWFRWDKNYLYVGVVSEDTVHGTGGGYWEGDGIQLRVEVGTTRTDNRKDLCVTFNANANWAVVNSAAAASLGYKTDVKYVDKDLHVTAAIPFAELGLGEIDVKAGVVLCYSMLRISAVGNYDDNGHSWSDSDPSCYAGWLAWGAFFGANHANNKNSSADNIVVLGNHVAETATVIRSNKAYNMVDINNVLSWGSPAIRVDKNSNNATLKNYEGTAEDTYMDIYTAWDNEYIYIGMVSPESDIRGWTDPDDNYKADGIQFGLSNGTTDQARQQVMVYLTFQQDGDSLVGKINSGCSGYQHSLKYENGNIYAAVRVPFADLELVADDIKAGLPLDFSILRISGTASSVYAGWLAWGAYFGAGHELNVNGYCDNNIVLSDEAADMATVVKADKVVGNVNLKDVTTWGKPTIHVDNDTYNAVLVPYPDNPSLVPDGTEMDVYTRWDNDYFYLGVVTPDSDLIGVGTTWKGDGIQFAINAGTTRTADAKNIHFALAANNGGVVCSVEYAHSIEYIDGKLHLAIAIPFADLGMTDVKDGTPICFSMIRFSGTAQSDYAGWLAWGTLWGTNERNTPGCVGDNVILLSDNIATTATTITSDKATSKVDITDIKSWGNKALTVDKNSFNTSLFNYSGQTAEDTYMDIYTTWDSKYLYIGIVSPDSDLSGCEDSWEGDGIQFKLDFASTVTSNAKNIYFTFNTTDGITTQIGSQDNIKESCEYSLTHAENNIMYAAIAVPFEKLGMVESDIKAGAEFGIDIVRISAKAASNGKYAGWLVWGAFWGANDSNNPSCSMDNKIVLVDSNAVKVDAVDSGDAFESLLFNIKDSAGTTASADGMDLEFGESSSHKIIKTADATYVAYLSNAGIVSTGNNGSGINEFLLVKIVDGEASEVAFGYVYGGLVDLVADKEDNIYVIGGSSSYTMDKLTGRNNGAEKAVLNIFKYDKETGALNSQKGYRTFTKAADHHTYLSSVIDQTSGKIYTIFAGANADGKYTDIEYFTYDLATSKWDKESKSYSVDLADIENSAVFALDGGVGFICSDGEEIHYYDATGAETMLTDANLEDAFVDDDGNVKILCGNPLKIVTITADGTIDTDNVTSQIPAAGFSYKFAKIGDELYIVAMDDENAARVIIFADNFEMINEVALDKVVKYSAAFMVANDLSGSSDTFTVMFAGLRGTVENWYSAEISVIPAVAAE